MKKLMYFFTPEDSTTAAAQGNISFALGQDNLNLGSLKALFWVLCTMGGFYLMTLI